MINRIKSSILFRSKRLINQIKSSPFFYKIRIRYLLPFGLYDTAYLKIPLEDNWQERIQDVMDCPDNALIDRHRHAGKVIKGKQVMHNGIMVTLGGYYGEPIVQMLLKNKGVHEPQEEHAFKQVLNEMSDGATMIELGAYWSFYSIWFNKEIKNARNYLVEPDALNMIYGLNNLRINNVKGKFTNAYIGKVSEKVDGTTLICIDDYVSENNIKFIDILHSDIQGYEHEMLLGASKTINEHKIGYIFISTHGNKVHYECLDFLEQNDFKILCNADEDDTYSLDGLIVARSKHIMGIEKIEISLKTKTGKLAKTTFDE